MSIYHFYGNVYSLMLPLSSDEFYREHQRQELLTYLFPEFLLEHNVYLLDTWITPLK